MPFLDILKELVDGVEGAVAAVLIGMDGIPIEKYSNENFDIETLGIEYGKVVEEIRNASEILSLGEVEEISVNTAGKDVLIKMTSGDYYIAFVIGGSANAGKARFRLRKAAIKAGKELSR